MLAEGCHGNLSEEVIKKYNLNENCKSKQTYGLGIKELWSIPAAQCPPPGTVRHTFGWPMRPFSYGGSFLYSAGDNRVALGYIVGLDYRNPYQDPFKDFQLFKTHRSVERILRGGKLIGYGARTLTEGGINAMPRLEFPGGILVGESAGLMDMGRLKGAHLAIHAGKIAAETAYPYLVGRKHFKHGTGKTADNVIGYDTALRRSSIGKDLMRVRNIRGAFSVGGLLPFMAHSALDMFLLHGRLPYNITQRKEDSEQLLPAKHPLVSSCLYRYPPLDGVVSFDRSYCLSQSGVKLKQTNQPSHLNLPCAERSAAYDFPETRFCPAGVYSYHKKDGRTIAVVNNEDCLHCKACEIKDPTHCLKWTMPQGEAGPNYQGM